ncbi:MAG: SDR family NAD(P)-dependent oxidoreductase [Pseudomonadota bacterium]
MSTTVRTALITGANRGIGRAIAASLLLHAGIKVLVAARNEANAEETAAALGGNVAGVALDLADPSAAAATMTDIESQYGPLDILVNNAGILLSGDALDTDLAMLDEALRVNTLGPIALMRVVGPGMRSRGWGRIVNLSSGWGSFHEGMEGPTSYAISKAALNAATVSFARALGETVKVNAMCPGWVRTRMGGDNASRSPEEGADTAVWLATLPDDGPSGGFFRDRQPIGW